MKKKQIIVFILFLLISLILADLVFADTVIIKDYIKLGDDPINTMATRLIQAALGVSGVLALLAFIYGGIMYLLAGVNPEFVKKGKEAMKWAVIGLAVIFSSYAIINFLLTTVLGVS